jgi:hypothetical protein
MIRIRRPASIAALFLMSVLGLVAAGPAAFAAQVAPSDGSDRPPVAPLVSSASGMAGWEIVLIAIAAAVVAAGLTAAALRLRFRSNVRVATA